MDKKARQQAIGMIISQQMIETQEELAKALQSEGFSVTQATVSRDIREMKLKKSLGINNRQYYTLNTLFEDDTTKDRLVRVLREGFILAEQAQNILVIKTISGMAMAVAASLDGLKLSQIVGSIAGDDTIMCVTKTNEEALFLKEHLVKLVSK